MKGLRLEADIVWKLRYVVSLRHQLIVDGLLPTTDPYGG
mgnify:CR=1 FL=1